MSNIKDRTVPLLAAGLSVLLLLWVTMVPSEARLGNLVKLVFLHGALVWTGLVTFSVAGALGLVALFARRRMWYNGTQAAGVAALVVWIVYAISAVVVTGLTWGQWIAWDEPRVRATALILVAAALLALVGHYVRNGDFTAVVNMLMGIAAWTVVRRAEIIRHPVDPIGTSDSEAMRTYYVLITCTLAGLAMLLGGWLWLRLQARGHIAESG